MRVQLGVKDPKSWVLIVSWLIQAFWPRGPYAHLVLTGEPGSGKSALTKTLKRLVDPSVTELRRPPVNEKDLMIAAQSERIIAFDNLSGLRSDLSDSICVLSTGGSLGARKLYSDDEEAFIEARRPVILNGIDAIATRGDLVDRSVIIDLPRILENERLTDDEMKARLDSLHPQLLGLILDTTAVGLRREKEIKIHNLPRMADFASWVMACEPALPWNEGEFMKIYRQANEDALVDLVEDDPFANAIIRLAQSASRVELKATNLWGTLVNGEGCRESNLPYGWPKSAKGIKPKLKRIAPSCENLVWA